MAEALAVTAGVLLALAVLALVLLARAMRALREEMEQEWVVPVVVRTPEELARLRGEILSRRIFEETQPSPNTRIYLH